MLIQRKVKLLKGVSYMYTKLPILLLYISTGCDVGVHYAITGLHVYTGTGTSCGSL